MWNYNYMIPSLMVLAIFLAYYFSMPHLSVRRDRTFLWILGMEGLIMVSDILSSKADEQFQRFSPGLLYVLNLVFFVLFLARAYLFYRFTLDLLRLKREKVPVRACLCDVVFGISELIALSSIWTGAVFFIDGEGYHKGPLYNVLYVCFFFYICLSVLMIVIHGYRLNRFAFISALGYHVILFIGNIVRILMPRYLVMHTFCLLAIIVIYLSFENPDLYLEDRGRVFNQRAFRETLDELVGTSSYRMLSFVIRNYNDSRGIYGGNQMDRGLVMISQYLKETFPAQTIFYLRSGRFVLLGSDHMDWDEIRGKIYERFQSTWEADNAELDLNVNFVEIEPDETMNTVDHVLSDLYLALEKAGQMEGDKDSLINPDSIREIERQVDVKRSLEKALERKEVEVFLQPLVDAKTGKIVSAEALARIRDAGGNLIMPGSFIPIAEKNGRIILMGEQVFEKTCQFIRDHDLDALGISWINVNLSPIQCMRKDLSDRFSEILEEYGVDADKIHLEITEESMVDFALLLKQIQTLEGHGFRFVLDDYGSGYSNLTIVKRCPFINIKLDMELVWDYFKAKDVLLPTIIDTFRQMNFSVTAEGIETEEMAEAMREMGCDFLQGYYFSKPMPMDEFVQKLSKAS